MGDGADARRPRRLAASTSGSRPAPGSRTTARPRGAARRRRRRLQDPRGLRRLPGADRRTSSRFADAHDVAVSLHTDGLHESAELEDTVAAIAGRTVHAYHVEGTGGGHVPDLLGLVREANILCSSTTPTRAVRRQRGGRARPDDRPQPRRRRSASPSDVELVRERVHPATMAAEGPLHELGAIGIVNSDSQGMGRIMETVRRTLQLAHVMTRVAGDRGRSRSSGPAGRGRRRRRRRRSASCATWPR